MSKQQKAIFLDVYNDFLEYTKKRSKKQSYDTLVTDFNKHILPYFLDKDIRKLTKVDIINWQSIILDFNYSNNFNRKLYYTFSKFIEYCILYSYLKENIVTQVGQFPKKNKITEYVVYNRLQFWWFRFNLKHYVIKKYFSFIYDYGTRPGEAMALNFTDNKGLKLRIIHNIQRKGKRELDTPKNFSSIRGFKISLLWKFRFWRLKRYYLKTYGYFNNDFFIFGGLKPLAPTTIDRYKKAAYEKAKLPPITQHEFRHSYATRKIHHRVPIDKVSRSMGHSQVSTTVDVYLHQEKNTFKVFP